MSAGANMSTNYERHPQWKRLTPELRARWDAATARGAFALDQNEKPWRDRVPFLFSKGYRLRARFQPNWRPSWLGTDIHPKDCEDSLRFTGRNVIDGKRIEDNKLVAIKHLRLSDPAAVHEVDMTRLASSVPGNDNRCIPFVDALEDAATDSLYLITEWTTQFDEPEFFSGMEVVDFVHQILDGLCFLHKQGIVHRDLAKPENLRMDPRPLTPGVTPHPQLSLHALDARPVSEPLRRSEAPRIRYFIAGFMRAMKVEDAEGVRLPTYVGSLPPPPGVGGFGEGDGGWSTAIPQSELAHSRTASYSTGGLTATPGPGTTTFLDLPDTPTETPSPNPRRPSSRAQSSRSDDDAATVVELMPVSSTATPDASPATTLTGTPASVSKGEHKRTESELEHQSEDISEATDVALPPSLPPSVPGSPRGSVDVRRRSPLSHQYSRSSHASVDSMTFLQKDKFSDSPRPTPLRPSTLGSPYKPGPVPPRSASFDKGKQREGAPPPPVPAKDPFKMDVYDLGTFFNREFLQKYAGLDFLQPLIDEMIRPSPHMRYTAEEALVFLRLIRTHGMGWFDQKWGLKRRDSTVGDAVVNGLYTGLNLFGIRKFRWQARIQDPMRPDKGLE